LWALARICLAPLDRWIGLVLLLPLATITVRRLRSMSPAEMLGMGLTTVGLALLILI